MESRTTNNVINAIKEVRELLNELKSNLSREEINRIRKELYKKEAVYNFQKQKDGLTDKEKIVLKNIGKQLKKLKNDLKNYKNIKIILHMAQIIYLMKSMKKTIMNQKKQRVLLMVVICYMKVEEIKMLN